MATNSASYDRWKKAVVHLECATDSQHFAVRVKRLEELREKFQRGEIDTQELAEGLSRGSRDVRFAGTAIFVRHAGARFLVTARHLLWDRMSAEREVEEETVRAEARPEALRQVMIRDALERSKNRIFSIIFRIPTLDEVVGSSASPVGKFLMNLGAGVSWMTPYTFSRPELDLAVLSLDQRGSNWEFADELESRGYLAVSSDDFVDGPSSEGTEVFTVGFPGATAILGERHLHPADAHWASSYVSIPTLAFGRVSMVHRQLEFFWCDMSIYPGNSGGPVVENDKLIGIVSAQPSIPVEGEGVRGATARIPFGKAIMAKYVVPLIEEQIEKDQVVRSQL